MYACVEIYTSNRLGLCNSINMHGFNCKCVIITILFNQETLQPKEGYTMDIKNQRVFMLPGFASVIVKCILFRYYIRGTMFSPVIFEPLYRIYLWS